jgi:hypothetical protein
MPMDEGYRKQVARLIKTVPLVNRGVFRLVQGFEKCLRIGHSARDRWAGKYWQK